MSVVAFTVDGRKIECEAGLTLLEAAKNSGIDIPALCNDPRLKPYGACRMCIVEIEGSPKYATACTTKVAEGMKVVTESEKIATSRKMVIELLLSDHPKDCLTCSKVGACKLQEYAYRYGVKDSRFYQTPDRLDVLDDNPYLLREQDKCILCGRCVRICHEVQGADIFDFGKRGFDTLISTSFNVSLGSAHCEYCGQCVDTCPTGALMGKSQRLSEELESNESTCLLCAVQCRTVLKKDSKTAELKAVTGSPDVGFNEGSLCKTGRWGWKPKASRLSLPLIRKGGVGRTASSKNPMKNFREATWEEAFDLAARRIKEIKETKGADYMGFLASAASSNEEAALLEKTANSLGTDKFGLAENVLGVTDVLMPYYYTGPYGENGFSSVENADLIFIVGAPVVSTHNVLASLIRQAKRSAGKGIVSLYNEDQAFSVFCDVCIGRSGGKREKLLSGILDALDGVGSHDGDIAKAAEMWKNAKNPLLVFDVPSGEDAVVMASLIKRLLDTSSSARVLDLSLPGNGRGVLEKGFNGSSSDVLKACSEGKVSGLYLLGEGFDSFSPKDLSSLDFLLVSDAYMTRLGGMADIILPSLPFYEKEGTSLNLEGRALSLSSTSSDLGGAMDGWKIISELSGRLGCAGV